MASGQIRMTRPSFVAAKDLIDDIATALDNTAEAVESTDSQIASQFLR